MRIDSAVQTGYERLSSGRRINGASDDAAGLAISQELNAQSNGYSKGIENGKAMQDLADTADGALSSIGDSLQRMRELAVQASNGILSNDDKKAIQAEINQIKGSISDSVKNTQFNTQKVLDGTFANKNIALNPQGTGMAMTIQDTGLATLGIQNFDVTGNFDISDIDKAMAKVSDARSNIGATTNSIGYADDASEIAEYNLEAADSGIADTDYASEMQSLQTNQILMQIKNYTQKQSMNQKASQLNLLG